jgi:hypothetical protein
MLYCLSMILSENRFPLFRIMLNGALGGTRTPTILLTATSRQRVYQFRHERLKVGTGTSPAGSTAPM